MEATPQSHSSLTSSCLRILLFFWLKSATTGHMRLFFPGGRSGSIGSCRHLPTLGWRLLCARSGRSSQCGTRSCSRNSRGGCVVFVSPKKSRGDGMPGICGKRRLATKYRVATRANLPQILGVDSLSILCSHRSFQQPIAVFLSVFGGFLERRVPGKNMEVTPRRNRCSESACGFVLLPPGFFSGQGAVGLSLDPPTVLSECFFCSNMG